MDNPNTPAAADKPARNPRPTNSRAPNGRPPRAGGPTKSGGPAKRGGAPKPAGSGGSRVSRGAAIRAQKRSQEDAQKAVNQYASAATQPTQPADAKPRRANVITDDLDKLKITFLGGQEGIGEKNMQVVEWKNDAIILDCGIDLSVELPGVNYAISDTTYLDSIKHKIRAYVISHGHLDHLGGLKHTVPKYPAPIYGSRFTIGIIEKSFDDLNAETGSNYKPETIIMNMDSHERLKLGEFMVELVRITHSVPESSCIIVDTPVGRIINTGDWRLDPEPLDEKPSDVERLKALGDEGVLLLMSDSTGTSLPGRTPTESTLQQSFYDVIGQAEGRVFVAIFSSNMNRVQMIVNAAVAAGRRVALDGRSMMSYAEIAVRQGLLKIPKGTVLAMREMPNVPDEQVLVICTGGQGEPNAALQRMAEGNHKYIKLHPGDTVVISSTPIPGNEIRYEEIGNELADKGVHLYRHPTHEIDGVGPLHVSGHARRDEHRELLHIIRPKFFLPIYAGTLNRKRHVEMAVEEGWNRKDVIMAENGDSILFTKDKWEQGPEAPHGSLLVDQTGSVVSGVVVKDRIMLAEEGLVAVILTVDRKTGALLTSPDIISRGFIYMRDSEDLMNEFRTELRRAVGQRFKRIELDRFKQELKDHVSHFLFENTGRAPIVIPVVNVISGGKTEGRSTRPGANGQERPSQGNGAGEAGSVTPPSEPRQQTNEELALAQQQRFQEMRARLLGQDQPD
jgi:ribonuclease J